MNYFEKVIVGFVFFLILFLGIIPLLGALALSFVTFDVAESFTMIYSQWNWLGFRIVSLLLLIVASAYAACD